MNSKSEFDAPIRNMAVARRFALWSALIALTIWWRARCSYHDYDVKRSTPECVVFKSRNPASQVELECHPEPIPQMCMMPHHISMLSPAKLARFLGDVGPLVVWLPLIAFAVLHERHARRLSVSIVEDAASDVGAAVKEMVMAPASESSDGLRQAADDTHTSGPREVDSGRRHGFHHHHHNHYVTTSIVIASLVYLAVIMPVRYLRRVLASGWDPSGHVLLYGIQLVPLWGTAQATTTLKGNSAYAHPTAARAVWLALMAAEAGLWVLTVATAAVFHHASEVLATWVVVGLTAYATHAALVPSASAAPDAVNSRAAQARLHRLLLLACILWLCGLLMPLSLMMVLGRSGARGEGHNPLKAATLAAAVGYDLVVAAISTWLIRWRLTLPRPTPVD